MSSKQGAVEASLGSNCRSLTVAVNHSRVEYDRLLGQKLAEAKGGVADAPEGSSDVMTNSDDKC